MSIPSCMECFCLNETKYRKEKTMLQFDVMEGTTCVSHVCVADNNVTVTRYRRGMLYPFSRDEGNVTVSEVKAFLYSRVFPPERDRVGETLKALDLREYNVLGIIEQTGGKLPTDHLSVVITERD